MVFNSSGFDNRLVHDFLALQNRLSGRKEVKPALCFAASFLQNLFERVVDYFRSAPTGNFQVDTRGHCLSVDGSWQQITGLSEGEAIGEGWIRKLHSEDRLRVEREMERSGSSGVSFEIGFRFHRSEEGLSQILCRFSPLRDDSRGVVGYLGSFTDISQLNQARIRLIEQVRLTELAVQVEDSVSECLPPEELGQKLCDILAHQEGVMSTRLWRADGGRGKWIPVAQSKDQPAVGRTEGILTFDHAPFPDRPPMNDSEFLGPCIQPVRGVYGEKQCFFAAIPLRARSRLTGFLGVYCEDEWSENFLRGLDLVVQEVAGEMDRRISARLPEEEMEDRPDPAGIGTRASDLSGNRNSIWEPGNHPNLGRENWVLFKQRLYAAIGQVQSQFILDADPHEAFTKLLEILLSLTNSPYGFIAELEYTSSQEPYLVSRAISNIAWNEETRRVFAESAETGLEFHNLDNLFGEVVKTGNPVISQDPASDPRRGGLPSGHPFLRSFLGLPLFHGEQLIGMVGVANRPIGYPENMADHLKPFLAACSNFIHAFRSERRRKAAVEALKEAELRYKDFYENAPVGYHSVGPDGRITDINRTELQMLGYAREEVIGKMTFNDLIPREFHLEWGEKFRELERTRMDRILQMELEMFRKDCRRFPVRMDLSVVRDPHGNFVGTRSVVTDISELRRSLEAQEIRLRYENGLAKCSRALADGDERVPSVQRALEFIREAAGVDRVCLFENFTDPEWGLCCGQTNECVADHIPPEGDNPVLKRIRYSDFPTWHDLLSGGKMISGSVDTFPSPEKEFLKGRGIVSILAIPIRLLEHWDGVVVFHDCVEPRIWQEEDVRLLNTVAEMIGNFLERKKGEEEKEKLRTQLIQSEKLSFIGTFISGIAHELNNPLTSILGFAEEVVESDLGDRESLLKNLSVIGQEAKRCSEIVSNLLLYARQQTQNLTKIDLHTVLKSAVSLIRHPFSLNAIKIRTEFSPETVLITGNFNQLQQVFLNILSNAHHSIHNAGGRGTVTIRTVEEPGGVRIEIENDGPPIPQAFLAQIFEPFFTTKKSGEGTGLGLWVCQNILTEHGGSISVKNLGDGEGVRFEIVLPTVERQGEGVAGPGARNEPLNGKGKTVLIVDDEASIVDVLRRILSRLGFEVQSAFDGHQAIELIKKSDFDLVISDVKMPIVDGISFFRTVSGMNPGIAKRFILISGDISPALEEFALQAGIKYVTKPFNRAKMIEVIRPMMDLLG